MPGLGEGDGRLHGLGIEDLADHDHVRRLAHRVLERAVVALGVDPHLTLIDNRLLVPVEKLDRVLDREDVAGLGRVAMIDHRRERGGLARAGRAHHQHQSARFVDDVLEQRRELEIVDGGNLALDRTDHHPHLAPLLEHVHPETAGILDRDGKIELEIAFEDRDLAFVHQGVSDLLHQARRKAGVTHRIQLPLDLDVHRRARGQEHVRGVLLGHQLEEISDVHGMRFACRKERSAGGLECSELRGHDG